MSERYEATPVLQQFYAEAWEFGVWIQEYGTDTASGLCVAIAGTRKKLEELERRMGREIEWPEFKYGDALETGGVVGRGEDRLAACKEAFRLIKEKMSKEAS